MDRVSLTADAVAPLVPERSRTEWLRSVLATTPGRLRAAGVLLVVATVVFGVVAIQATETRRSAAVDVAQESGPLVGGAAGLYASLSDADATAASTFLVGGLEPAARRRRYLADLRSAGGRLVEIAHRVGDSSPAADTVSRVSTLLPIYSGLVEAARTNNRQGLPVGAAYLRQASDLMRSEILPAAGGLFAIEARGLGADYRRGTSSGRAVAVIGTAALTLALVIAIQLWITRLTARVFNVPLLLATGVLVGLLAWAAIAFSREQTELSSAQRKGSDLVQVLSTTRILALRAQADESLALVARGGGESYQADFDAVMRALVPARSAGGLLAQASALARPSGTMSAVDGVAAMLSRYRLAHRRVAVLESDGRFDDAVQAAIGARSEAALFDRLDHRLRLEIASAQRRLNASARAATSALGGLRFAIPALLIVFVLLALLGLRQRLVEYG